MRAVLVLLALAAACATPRNAGTLSNDAGASLVPDAALHARATPPPPPVDERLTLVQPLSLGEEVLVGPRVLAGRAPSHEHPEGTAFSETNRAVAEDGVSGYYVFEWDIATGQVAHTWEKPGRWASFSFDGRRLFLLWSAGRYGKSCWLDTYDTETERTRARQIPCGWHEVIATRDGGYVVTRETGDQTHPRLELVSFDARGVRRGDASLVVPPITFFYSYDQRVHAGDSIYSLIAGEDGHTHLVRLDDRTLHERGRSVALDDDPDGGDGHYVLRKADDRWLVWASGPPVAVTAALERVEAPDGFMQYADDWYNGKQLALSTTPPGSLVEGACTPRWVHGQPIFGCLGPSGLTMVRAAHPH